MVLHAKMLSVQPNNTVEIKVLYNTENNIPNVINDNF